eukprot:TRINITY_DN13117_c0_g1_i1.p1 TRINITY_DN13117_c0_g1~~TRINITY_DN13117_c0_g1_i1.p1  ORF type:complete len:152 (+),score=48.67 TRINITY_DN13117_c0_g1_i1:41-496(+)
MSFYRMAIQTQRSSSLIMSKQIRFKRSYTNGTLDAKDYEARIMTCLQDNDIEQAQGLFGQLKQNNVTATEGTFEGFIDYYLRNDRLNDAVDTNLQMRNAYPMPYDEGLFMRSLLGEDIDISDPRLVGDQMFEPKDIDLVDIDEEEQDEMED